MGKGKGLIERKIIRIRRGVTLFEFKGVSKPKLIWLVNKINKKLKIKINVFYKKTDIFYKI
jgi:ribosomal protein L16/L10AE